MQYISHHGVKGQKWGVRRYQNPDGSLTTLGRIHYGYDQKGRVQTYVRGKKITPAQLAHYRTYVLAGGGRFVQKQAKQNIKDKKLYDAVKKTLWAKPLNEIDDKTIAEGRKWLDKTLFRLMSLDPARDRGYYTNRIMDLDTWLNGGQLANIYSMNIDEVREFENAKGEIVNKFKKRYRKYFY